VEIGGKHQSDNPLEFPGSDITWWKSVENTNLITHTITVLHSVSILKY